MSQMTCGEFVEVVHGLVRMEVLDVALREDALEHAARCSRCLDIMTEARFLADATEAMASASRSLQTPPRVSAALVQELHKNQVRVGWWRNMEWAAAGALAAVLVVGFWVGSLHSKSPAVAGPRKTSQSSGPIEAANRTASPLGAAGNQASASSVNLGQLNNPSAVADSFNGAGSDADTLTSDNLTASSAATDTAAGDFVSVPYSDAIAPDDDGMVVRVQLTRESLAQLGYPVDEVHGSDWVRADVLVGQDGWPRGVRLVQ